MRILDNSNDKQNNFLWPAGDRCVYETIPGSKSTDTGTV